MVLHDNCLRMCMSDLYIYSYWSAAVNTPNTVFLWSPLDDCFLSKRALWKFVILWLMSPLTSHHYFFTVKNDQLPTDPKDVNSNSFSLFLRANYIRTKDPNSPCIQAWDTIERTPKFIKIKTDTLSSNKRDPFPSRAKRQLTSSKTTPWINITQVFSRHVIETTPRIRLG